MKVIDKKFPPDEARERLDTYKDLRNLFLGRHHEVFKRVQDWLDSEVASQIIYIVCNFAGLISKVCADFLFGEPIIVTVGEEGSTEQEAIEEIIENNALHIKNYEMALSSSWRGDTVLKVRYGKRKAWDEEPSSIIETVPAEYFFPHLNGDNIQEMTGATLAWVKEKDDLQYLRKEIHEPGIIKNELWLLEGTELVKKVPLSIFEEYKELEEQQETGYAGLLVFHIPNWRLDDMFWGISDYYDLQSLLDALNNRVSRMDTILDKHSDPKLILPPGTMKFDHETQDYYIEKEYLQAMEVSEMSENSNLPRYLVWDAHLEAAFSQIDKLLELLMMFAEVSPAAFGMDADGVSASGRALKFKLIRTFAKINRKQLYLDNALKEVLYAAQVLENEHGSKRYEPTIPHIEWKDGLPDDPMEMAEIEALRISSSTTSIESAIRRLDGLTGEALEEELKRIEEERQSQRPESPFGSSELNVANLFGGGDKEQEPKVEDEE